jgi:outer membrane protein assembly factor BamC
MGRTARRFPRAPLLTLLACGAVAGCGSVPSIDDVVKDRQIEYRSAQSAPPLEIPPDLSRSSIDDRLAIPDTAPPGGTARYSEYAGERAGAERIAKSGVLPDVPGIRVVRDGDKRWLVADGDPTRYWERTREFWLQNGFTLKIDNPTAGVMETDWAENRANIPDSWLRQLLGKAIDSIHSTATRDLFRTRLERGSGNTTEIYVSHRGVEEVVRSGVSESTVWQPRPSDPELEAEILNRLMVFLGVKKEQAQQLVAKAEARPAQARLERDAGGPLLLIDNTFEQAWRRTGLALDRVGFTVEDRDRSRGLYFVRYVDSAAESNKDPGFFSRLFGADEKDRKLQYVVAVKGDGATSRVTVNDRSGARDGSQAAEKILRLLQDELK